MVTGRHLGLRGEMHVYSGCVDVRGGGASWRPLHWIVWGVGVASNWERGVGSGRGRCRLGHNGRMARRWGGNVECFWTIVLEIGVIAVFSRIVDGFYGRVRTRGLGRGSQRVRGSGRLHHSIGVIHSSSRGRIRLHVAIRWIPRVVVHRVGVMWITPRSSRIVRMVGVGNEGGLLPRGGRLRSRRGRSSDFQRSRNILMDRWVRVRWIDGSASEITVHCIPHIRHGEVVTVVASCQMSLNTTFPSEPTGWIQVTNLDSNSTAVVDAIILCLYRFPRGFRVVKLDKRKG